MKRRGAAPRLVEVLAVLPGERTQLPDDVIPVVGRLLEEPSVPLRPLRGTGHEFPKAAARRPVDLYAAITGGEKPLGTPSVVTLQRRERHRQLQRRQAHLRPRRRLGLRGEAEIVSPPHGADRYLRFGVDTHPAARRRVHVETERLWFLERAVHIHHDNAVIPIGARVDAVVPVPRARPKMLPWAGKGILQSLVEGIQDIAVRGDGLPPGGRLHSRSRALASGVSVPWTPHGGAPSRQNPDEQDYAHRRLLQNSLPAAWGRVSRAGAAPDPDGEEGKEAA